jgi:hypothetical protein
MKILIVAFMAIILQGCFSSSSSIQLKEDTPVVGASEIVETPQPESEQTQPSYSCQLHDNGDSLGSQNFNLLSRDQSYTVTTNNAYYSFIDQASSDHNISSVLIAALITQESAWDANAISHIGAKGLTQVISTYVVPQLNDTFFAYYTDQSIDPNRGEEPLIFDPQNNVDLGVKYLRWIRELWLQNQDFANLLGSTFPHAQTREQELLKLIIASYNFGPFGMKTYLESHGPSWYQDLLNEQHTTYHEVANYVPSILHYCESLGENL